MAMLVDFRPSYAASCVGALGLKAAEGSISIYQFTAQNLCSPPLLNYLFHIFTGDFDSTETSMLYNSLPQGCH